MDVSVFIIEKYPYSSTIDMMMLATLPSVGGVAVRPPKTIGPSQCSSLGSRGLYEKTPEMSGIIDRKLMGNRADEDKKSKSVMETFMAAHKEEVNMRRESRIVPEDPYELVEFFLETEATDMNFEVARCRPKLDEDFFALLNKQIGIEKISPTPDEERVTELEMLRDYLTEAVEAVDTATQQVSAAPERLKSLLEAANKKEKLREMASNGEIDQAFMDLLEQNIEGAQEAGREDVAEFMTKVRQAAGKFMI
eukprot:jgi/Picre1/28829/NNA_004226.t1